VSLQAPLDLGGKLVACLEIGIGHIGHQDREPFEGSVALGTEPKALEEFPVALERLRYVFQQKRLA
jgi:hypothetical protein